MGEECGVGWNVKGGREVKMKKEGTSKPISQSDDKVRKSKYSYLHISSTKSI